jgi:hypothetical protein
MIYFLTQTVLAGRRSDDGLMNILWLVVFIVIWAIAGIVKAKSQKAQQKDNQSQSQSKPPRKRQINKELSEQILEKFFGISGGFSGQGRRVTLQQSQLKAPFPRPISQPVKKAKTASYPDELMARKQNLTTQVSSLKSYPEQPVVAPIAENIKTVEQIPNIADEFAKTNYLDEILPDNSDLDEMKKAILYMEIFGKPLAMRDTQADSF